MVRQCLIVDDNEWFLEIAHTSLERQGMEVVGTARTIAEAVQKVAVLRPRIILVDIALGRESGFELTRRLVDEFPDLGARVVLISTRGEEDFADLIADSPAVGFLSKSLLTAQAVEALVGVGE